MTLAKGIPTDWNKLVQGLLTLATTALTSFIAVKMSRLNESADKTAKSVEATHTAVNSERTAMTTRVSELVNDIKILAVANERLMGEVTALRKELTAVIKK